MNIKQKFNFKMINISRENEVSTIKVLKDSLCIKLLDLKISKCYKTFFFFFN